MGDHDSFADFGRAAAAAARSARIRAWVLRLVGAACLWLAAWIKGWEASIVYQPSARKLERRIGALEDAGVAMDVQVIETVVREVGGKLDQHILDEQLLEEERYRNWLRSVAPASRLESVLRKYEMELDRFDAQGRLYPPHIAADRALGLSRPPGR